MVMLSSNTLLPICVLAMSCFFGVSKPTVHNNLSSLDLHVKVELFKGDYGTNCSVAVLTDLENEVREWIDEELHEVVEDTGAGKYSLFQIVAVERSDELQVSALVRCQSIDLSAFAGGEYDDKSSFMKVVATSLQWSAPEVIRRWFIDASKLVKGCMGDRIDAAVTVKPLDFNLDAHLRQPIILGIDEILVERNQQNATTVGYSALA